MWGCVLGVEGGFLVGGGGLCVEYVGSEGG